MAQQINGQFNIFGSIPVGFFNLLASGSNQDIYSECLLLIYEQFEKEISYRMDRKQLRDILATSLMEQKVSLSIDGEEQKNYTDLANAIIRKLSNPNIGWLEEETDDSTLEKAVFLTENGVFLSEFLLSIRKPEKVEYSGYIIEIRNTLFNDELWQDHPYIHGVKSINAKARALSKSLKRLSTYIRKNIEKMFQENTYESITNNLIDYFEGDFVKEYSRLIKEQNVYRYRHIIREQLETIKNDEPLVEKIIEECQIEEDLTYEEASEKIDDLFIGINKFLFDDYEKIMIDIKNKINIYLSVGIGRLRIIQNQGLGDDKNNIEKVIRIISEKYSELKNKDYLPEEFNKLFTLDKNEYIDTMSLRFPGKERTITTPTTQKLVKISDNAIEKEKERIKKVIENPYSKEKAKEFFEYYMQGKNEITSDDLPIRTKEDMFLALSGAIYAGNNGFSIEILDEYAENPNMILHKFRIRKENINELQ